MCYIAYLPDDDMSVIHLQIPIILTHPMKYERRLNDKNQTWHHGDKGQDLQSSFLYSRFKIFFYVFYIDLAEGLLEEDSRKDDGEYRPGGQDHLLDGERHLLQGEVRHQAVAAGDDAPGARFTISLWGQGLSIKCVSWLVDGAFEHKRTQNQNLKKIYYLLAAPFW